MHFNDDRSYIINGGDPSDDPPEWLDAVFGTDSDTGDKIITYKVPSSIQNGYYKWDNNTTWVKYNSEDTLITTPYESNNVFYYMDELPEYDTMAYITAEHTETADNPTGVNIYGYFRISGTSDWIYHNIDDLITSITVDQSLIIQYLVVNTSANLKNVKIRIQPRWWKL